LGKTFCILYEPEETVEQTWKKPISNLQSIIFRTAESVRQIDWWILCWSRSWDTWSRWDGRLMDGHGVMARRSHSGDSVNQLETMPSKVEARHTEGWIMLDLTIQYDSLIQSQSVMD